MTHEKDGYENMEQKLTSLNLTKDIEIKTKKIPCRNCRMKPYTNCQMTYGQLQIPKTLENLVPTLTSFSYICLYSVF